MGVKITVVGVDRQQRKDLKRACLDAETSISHEIRKRLPRLIREIEGSALSYEELSDLLTALVGVLNMSLSGMDQQARAAMRELEPKLNRFRLQLQERLSPPSRY